MASVGGVACNFVRGYAAPQRERVQTWQVAGLDGYGAQVLGTGDSQLRIRAVYFASESNVSAWAVLLMAMQGSVVSVVNDWGRTFTGCLLTSVGTPAITVALGPGITARGEIEIRGVVA